MQKVLRGVRLSSESSKYVGTSRFLKEILREAKKDIWDVDFDLLYVNPGFEFALKTMDKK